MARTTEQVLEEERSKEMEADNAELCERVKKLTDALQELYDCQNGPPLLGRHEKAWNEAMAIAGKILMESQNVDE